ncbi:MAG: MATE family efflux transporter [Oscillospiraceae bacterium]|nr:MATE family efflux transporter [Oscillospiraceae bacterium]
MLRKIFKQMLVAQILSAMTVMICMLVDSLMIGRFLGVDSMTAYGLASPVLLIFAAFGSMLTAGIQVICGKTMGSGDREATNAVYSASVMIALVISAVGVLLVLAFATPICGLLGAGKPTPDNEVFTLTRDYLRGFIVGAPAFILAQICVPFLQISGNRSRLAIAVIAMTIADIVFDALNVFVFNGGTLGMGLASSLSYVAAIAIGGSYFLKKDCMFKFRPRSVSRRLCGELFRAGIPTVINQLSLVLLVFALNKILLEVGQNAAVAAYSVISTVGNLCYCFGSGVASVALLLSSIFYSDEDKTALRELMKTMCRYSALLVLAVTAVVLLAAPYLIRLFLQGDPDAVAMATEGLRLFSLSLLPCAFNTSLKNYYQGVNRTRFTEAISVMQNFTFTALFAFLLSRFWKTTGVWLGFVCGETLTLLIIFAVVWIREKRIVLSADAFALLPKDFGVSERDCLERSIVSMEEATIASQQAAAFCAEHGDTSKTGMQIALCIEEMVSNIILHGFTKDKREHSVELRLICKEDKTHVIRIRDNCVNFDPLKYLELHKTDDPIAHIGIRMVMKTVKSATYVNSLGLNNLTLVL